MKKMIRSITIIAALAVLLSAFGIQAVAADTAETVNILAIGSEREGDTFYPTMPMIISLDFATGSVRIVYFHYATQIMAVTRDAGALSIPMKALSYCDYSEIVKAFENAFGIKIDRYMNFQFVYGDHENVFLFLNALCPLTLDIPAELLGDTKYTSVNWYMGELTRGLDIEYTKLTEMTTQTMDAIGLGAYICAAPDRLWKSGDQFTMMMEEYKYQDVKYRAIIEALKSNIAQMDRDAVLAIWRLLLDGQETDITAEDIAAWSEAGLNFIGDTPPLLTVPGFEGVEMVESEAKSVLGVRSYYAQMLVYDTAAAAQRVQEFLSGE